MVSKKERIRIYKELAEQYCDSNRIRFFCNDIGDYGFRAWSDIQYFPEVIRFSRTKKLHGAWLCLSNNNNDYSEDMKVKTLIMLFCAEICKDEKKVQKKSSNRNI